MRILITTNSFGVYSKDPLEVLTRAGVEIRLNPFGSKITPEEIVELADGCVGIIAGTERYSAETLAKLRHLKVISRCGGGLDGIDLEAAGRQGIVVTSTPYGPTQAVAELTLGIILNLIRHVALSTAEMRQGKWKKHMGFLLSELTIGIVGLGRIGKRLATSLRALDAQVVGYDIKPDISWAKDHQVEVVTFDEVLRRGDVICLHLPYTKEFHYMIGKSELARMKQGSFLVNTSRGGIVEEQALYSALKSGYLQGAALDTFEQEPYEGPLRELDNVILTPHIGSYARASRITMEQESVANLIGELQQQNILPII